MAHALSRTDGRLGFIAAQRPLHRPGHDRPPRSCSSRCRWEWLFGFENRDGFSTSTVFQVQPRPDRQGGQTPSSAPPSCAATPTTGRGHRRGSAVPYARAGRAVQPAQGDPRDPLRPRPRGAGRFTPTPVLLGDQGPGGWGITYALSLTRPTTRPSSPRGPSGRTGYRPDESTAGGSRATGGPSANCGRAWGLGVGGWG